MASSKTPDQIIRQPPDVTLWLDRYAELLGFGYLAGLLPVNLPPSYLYAGIVVTIFTLFDLAYDLIVIGGQSHVYYVNPYFVLQPILLLVAVYGARSLRQEYVIAAEEMNLAGRASDDSEENRLINIVPNRLPWILFVVAAGVQFFPGLKDTTGWIITDYIANYGIFPFVYTPIIIQFLAIYVSIEFFAPWRLSQSSIGIDFLDPEGVGGLRPLGELIKRAYYYIAAGLIGYALITYAPFVDSEWVVTPSANILFTSVWIASIASVAFAIFILHRFMRKEKRVEIQRLQTELTDHIEDRYDMLNYQVPNKKEDYIDDLKNRIARVSQTNEYPATFNVWVQILLSIALPKALQFLIAKI